MQEVMNVTRHTAGGIAVADAVRQDYASDVVAAGENGRKITAFIASRGNGDDVAFQASELQRTMRFLIAGPQFHASEGPHDRPGAIKLLRFDFLDLHAQFDVR